MRLRPILTLFISPVLATVLLHGQIISEDEIRIGSRPYTPGASHSVRLQSNLVEVGVVVRDSHGKLIAGLEKKDFEVYDEGRKQNISLFSVEVAPRVTTKETVPSRDANSPPPAPALPASAPKPRYVALFFDDTSTALGDLVAARKAAETFARNDFESGDKIGVFTSSTTVTLGFTEDREKLLTTLAQLRPRLKRPDLSGTCPRLLPYQAYLITLNYGVRTDAFDLALAECPICSSGGKPDAQCINSAAQETLSLAENTARDTLGFIGDVITYLGKMPGRRMLVLTSSGFMTQTLGAQQDKVLNVALQAKVIINSLEAQGLAADWLGGDPTEGPPVVFVGPLARLWGYRETLVSTQRNVYDDPLAMLADGTGGRFFHNSNDLGRGLREMAALPEFSYILGFSPQSMKANGSFHNIKVKLPNQHEATITARKGYFAPDPEKKSQPSSLTKMEKMDREVLGIANAAEFPAEVNAETGKLGSGEPALRVTVHVDVRTLPFTHRDDRRVERLIFVTALFDSNGKFLTGIQQIMDLNLKDATLMQISGRGVTANLSLQAPPGSYRLREVVQEEATGRMATLSRAVEIH